jgi:hypothetical protein
MQSIVPPVVLGTRFAIVDAYSAPRKLRFAFESVEKLLNEFTIQSLELYSETNVLSPTSAGAIAVVIDVLNATPYVYNASVF